MLETTLVRVADGVHLVHGSSTNWVILSEGDAVTLIDCGYPGDRELLLRTLSELGHAPESVVAVLVTHAHSDHIGSAEYFSRVHGTPVHLHETEVPHARREFLDQVGVGRVLCSAWRPSVLHWAVHALRSGGTSDVRVTAPEPLPDTAGGPLDLPGRPVPVHTPGHTAGHCAYVLPRHGVLVSGDALVTGHPTSRVKGPQLLPVMFDKDRRRALESLGFIEDTASDILLPGHGPVHHGPIAHAVCRARELAS
ncbi:MULTISPECIES: MBL fold metallo-hydrolase [Streptomyces]|uniref:MBL fold metallo-hydrolase n=1 Tax=Streptomyces sp. B146 TaxID=2944251 RepID=UPI00240DFD41|nr:MULTISPECIES: MBL fold metallo-hydrolase [Streptomyces]WFB88523.1 MBL fold metallo-hydrolase [Streptomyces olivaceus]WGK50665.1 MBL fold metallo-hydrolase [Streptomyces sp. B146]